MPSWCHAPASWRRIKAANRLDWPPGIRAERAGFEPAVPGNPTHRISNPALSATQPSLRVGRPEEAAGRGTGFVPAATSSGRYPYRVGGVLPSRLGLASRTRIVAALAGGLVVIFRVVFAWPGMTPSPSQTAQNNTGTSQCRPMPLQVGPPQPLDWRPL